MASTSTHAFLMTYIPASHGNALPRYYASRACRLRTQQVPRITVWTREIAKCWSIPTWKASRSELSYIVYNGRSCVFCLYLILILVSPSLILWLYVSVSHPHSVAGCECRDQWEGENCQWPLGTLPDDGNQKDSNDITPNPKSSTGGGSLSKGAISGISIGASFAEISVCCTVFRLLRRDDYDLPLIVGADMRI